MSNIEDPPAADGVFQTTPAVTSTDAGTTIFRDDTVGQEASQPSQTSISSGLITAVTSSGSQTINEFLEKPTRIATGSLAATDTTKLFELDPFDTLLSSVKSLKLVGTYMIRSELLITLQVNAVRFQAGRYILGWVPMAGFGNTTGAAAFYRMHTANLMTVTQLPHVEIDLAKQTHVQLRIPFLSAYTHLLSKSTASFKYGTLFLLPYVPLIPGSADTTAPFTVWASFVAPLVTGSAIQQSGRSPGRQEQVKAGVGPISSIAAKVSKSAQLIGQVPLMTSAMTAVSWISDIVGSVATVWGFSKPPVLSAPNRFVRTVYPYIANADQFTTAAPLAVMSTNEVVLHSGVGGTNVDQLAFDYIKKQWCYYTQVSWTTAMVADTVLSTTNHSIVGFQTAMGKGFTYPPFTLCASYFRFWRGGLRVRFKLVKTEFHSGRLMITYTPTFHGAAIGYTATAAEYLHREIVDIRDASEFEFEVPYVSPELYTLVGDVVGVFTVAVLDPLIAPNTVSSTVPMLFEISGADDLEFAFPDYVGQYSSAIEPYAPAVPMSGYVAVPPVKLGVTSSSHEPAATAIGEKIMSFRQLLKRQQFVGDWTGTSLAYYPLGEHIVSQGIASNADPLVRNLDVKKSDLISVLNPSYLFVNGSMVVKATPASNANDIFEVSISYSAGANGNELLSTAGYQAVGSIRSSHYVRGDIDGAIDVVVPSYHRHIARETFLQATNSAITCTGAQGANPMQLLIQNVTQPAVATNKFRVTRSTGEDFNFTGWLGTVPYVLSTAV
jgi:hypothetical protein